MSSTSMEHALEWLQPSPRQCGSPSVWALSVRRWWSNNNATLTTIMPTSQSTTTMSNCRRRERISTERALNSGRPSLFQNILRFTTHSYNEPTIHNSSVRQDTRGSRLCLSPSATLSQQLPEVHWMLVIAPWRSASRKRLTRFLPRIITALDGHGSILALFIIGLPSSSSSAEGGHRMSARSGDAVKFLKFKKRWKMNLFELVEIH